MNVMVQLYTASGDCLGNDAVVTTRSAMWRQFSKDIKELSALKPLKGLDQFHDSEVIDYLDLLGSQSMKVNVTLVQGNDVFKAEWVFLSHLGKESSNGVTGTVQTAETLLTRVLVEVLAARRILQKNDAPFLNSCAPGELWWCEDHWIKVDNFAVGDGTCWGNDSVLLVKRALSRQFDKDIRALSTLKFLPNLHQLSDAEVNDCLHLVGCESVSCKITLQREVDAFNAEWNLPSNSVVKSSQSFCTSCGIVLPETVLGRILVEVLAANGLLHKQPAVESSSQSVPLTAHGGMSPIDTPTANNTLKEQQLEYNSPPHQVHTTRHEDSVCSSQPEEVLNSPGEDSHTIFVTSTSSDPPLYNIHEPFLESLKFEAEEKVKIHDPLVEEPMDTTLPQTPVGGSLNKQAKRSNLDRPPKLGSPSFRLPIRSQMMKISIAVPENQKYKKEKERVLSIMKREQSILNLRNLTGLRCNMDPDWSLEVLKCASKCKKLHRVEVLWPRREHWYWIQELCYLRKLEIYGDDELYQNPPKVRLSSSHALRIETIQAEGLHPSSLGSLMKAHRSSLTRLEVLVDLPRDCSLPRDRPLGPQDGGRPLTDEELRKLLERAPSQAGQAGQASSFSQENNTKMVRVALRKPRNVPLSLALPVSMFLPKDWRRKGSGRSGAFRRAGLARRPHREALFSEYAVPVEEDCRRYPNLQVLVLNRAVEHPHNSGACNLQIQKLRRKWPSMAISCGRSCDKNKKGQTQRGSETQGEGDFCYFNKRPKHQSNIRMEIC